MSRYSYYVTEGGLLYVTCVKITSVEYQEGYSFCALLLELLHLLLYRSALDLQCGEICEYVVQCDVVQGVRSTVLALVKN